MLSVLCIYPRHTHFRGTAGEPPAVSCFLWLAGVWEGSLDVLHMLIITVPERGVLVSSMISNKKKCCLVQTGNKASGGI